MSILTRLQKCEPSGMVDHEVPVAWDRAKGSYVWDDKGKRYIDFTSGIFVTNIGHRHPKVVAAIKEQADKCLYSYIFPSEIRARLAEKLLGITGMDKVLFTVTGSEANEAALQMMMRYRKGRVLAIKGCYYGSTSGVRKLTEDAEIDETIWPDEFKAADVAGIFLQCFRGKDCHWFQPNWITTWFTWAKENGIPVAWDEMQSGIGRTGHWFGYQGYRLDNNPDLVCVGKALGAGMPISCVMGSANLLALADDLWSTHSGNPVCCAAALAGLEVVEDEKLIDKAWEIQDVIRLALQTPFLYGVGALHAIDLHDVNYAERVAIRCADKGLLLVSTHAGTIKIAPPLTIPMDVLTEGLSILKEAIIEC